MDENKGRAAATSELSAGLAVLPFNINENVLVKLNERGRAELRRQHDELAKGVRANGGKGWEYRPPTEDSKGWSKWQLWDLMSRLGHLCHLGSEPPFETEIRICADNSNSSADSAD